MRGILRGRREGGRNKDRRREQQNGEINAVGGGGVREVLGEDTDLADFIRVRLAVLRGDEVIVFVEVHGIVLRQQELHGEHRQDEESRYFFPEGHVGVYEALGEGKNQA